MSDHNRCKLCAEKPGLLGRLSGGVPRGWRTFSEVLTYEERERVAPQLGFGRNVPESSSYLLCPSCQDRVRRTYDQERQAETDHNNKIVAMRAEWPRIKQSANREIAALEEAFKLLTPVTSDLKKHLDDPSIICPGTHNISRPERTFSDFALESTHAGDPWPEILELRKEQERTVGGETRFSVSNFENVAALIYSLIENPIGIEAPKEFIEESFRDFLGDFAKARGIEISTSGGFKEIDCLFRPMGRKDGSYGVWINNFALYKTDSATAHLCVIYQYQDFRG